MSKNPMISEQLFALMELLHNRGHGGGLSAADCSRLAKQLGPVTTRATTFERYFFASSAAFVEAAESFGSAYQARASNNVVDIHGRPFDGGAA